MKIKQKTGIVLCQSVEMGIKPQNRMLLSGLALLLSAAWIGGLGDVAGLWKTVGPWPALLSAAVVCVLWTVLSTVKKEQLFMPVVLGLLLVTALLLGSFVTDGACLLWNQIGEIYTVGTGRLLPELQIREGAENHTGSLFLCLAILGGLLGLLSIGCVQRGKIVAAILTPIVLFVALLLFQKTQLSGWIIVSLAVCLLLLLSGGRELQRKGQFWPVAGGAVCAAIAFGLVVALMLLPGADRWAAEMKEQTAEKLHQLCYETEHTVLPEGELADYDNESHVGYTALLVTMDQPEALYLRGFVGQVYEDGVWTAADVGEEKDLLYWLQREAFYPQTQFEAAAASMNLETNRITVQNVNACSKFSYVPYALKKSGMTELDPMYLQTGALDAGGSRSYSYQTLYAASDRLQDLLVLLKEEEKESILAYRLAESGYRLLAYEQNLQVPEETIKQLSAALDACCAEYGSVDELTLGEAQNSALAFLSLYFGDWSEDVETVLPHLKGSHYQYATVATLALRYYGIPARYVEGFYLSEELAAEGGQIAVDNSCARAWVEVYQDGVGWLPLELTPGFEALAGKETESGIRPVGVSGIDPNAPSGSEVGEGEGSPLTEGKENEPDNTEQENSGGMHLTAATIVTIQKALKWMGILLVIAGILMLLLVVLRRVYLLRKKQKLFESGDLREAIGWIYADAALFLSELGLDRGCGSMDSVCTAAEERFGSEYGQICREMKQLNDLAIFSNHVLEEVGREKMLAFRMETLAHMKKHVKWYRKLWMQWIPCVY